MASVDEAFNYLATNPAIEWPPQIVHTIPHLKIAFLKKRLENLERELPLKLAGNGVTKFFGGAQSLEELDKMEAECKKEADAIREVFKAQYDVFAALAEVEGAVYESSAAADVGGWTYGHLRHAGSHRDADLWVSRDTPEPVWRDD